MIAKINKMAHCEKCGHRISEEMMYCENCGTKTHFAEEKLKAEKEKQKEHEKKERERREREEENERIRQEKEREKEIKLKQEKRKAFINKLKKPKVLIPLVIVIIALLVIFVPVRIHEYNVKNSITVPFQRQESYQETEPYQDTEYYSEALSYSVTNKDECTTSGIFGWKKATYGIYIVNTDSQAGFFSISITFHLDGGSTLHDDVQHYLNRGDGDWFRVEDNTIKWDGVVNSCDYSISPQLVQKSRIVTKYRSVTKYRTVTDYKQEIKEETRYEKVNWLFRFNQPYGIVFWPQIL